jgi:2-oxoisovalerate dehydrogenase E1 component alpha subunit
MGAHTTSDDPTKYRCLRRGRVWKLRDPIARLRTLLARSLRRRRQDFFDACDAEADTVGADLRERCLAMPDPSPLRCSTMSMSMIIR